MPSLKQLEYGPLLVDAYDLYLGRFAFYRLYREYYNGIHPMAYVSSAFRSRYGDLFSGFSDNLCEMVVDAHESALELEAIQVGNAEGNVAEPQFRRWRMDALQSDLHQQAFMLGDAFAVLWDGPGGLTLYPQLTELVIPVYSEDEPGLMLAAMKMWQSRDERGTKITRVSVYYADRLERYYVKGEQVPNAKVTSLTPLEAPGLPHIEPHAFGRVPVFHFANRAAPGRFGVSELRSVRSLQDSLNKSLFDLMVNGERTSLAQRYAIGVEAEIDPATGRAVNPFEGKSLWMAPSPDAKFGQLDAGDSEQLLAIVNDYRREIARVSRVPIRYFDGQATESGEALKMAEAPFTRKIRKAQALFGNVWEEIFAIALERDPDQVGAVWHDPAPRSETETWNVALNKRAVGVSTANILRDAGYSEAQIQQNQQERAEEDQAAVELAQRSMTRDPEAR